jgi:hypothetical protein
LFEYGSMDDRAGSESEAVEELRAAALEELERRGTDPAMLEWLRSDARTPPPEEYAKRPGPADWRVYWDRVYNQW